MKNRIKQKAVGSIVLIVLSVFVLGTMTGCESMKSWVQSLKGELIGNSYQIWEYDNFGNKILTASGDKIALECDYDENGELSSYVNITIDGHEWNHVGNTLVFAQQGVDMITDFQVPENIGNENDSSGLIAVDRIINNYKNQLGKECAVIVFSQTGAPICMFQGDSCYSEVPGDLPKTTKLSIDGKLVYVHRANIDIIPVDLID